MKRIGIFLGVKSRAGGMFQYAESLLEALRALPPDRYEVHAAYAQGLGGALGLKLSQLMLVLCVPARLARALAWLNPLYHQLKRACCDAWIFPAQEALTYQLPLSAIGTIHDLMHRYEPHFPEVSGAWRTRVREHRFRNLARSAHAILVDSEVGKRHVIESYGTPAEKIFPLPYVPAPSILNYRERPDFEARYPLPEKFFFYPAQFWAHKNHARLISAAAQIPGVQLVFTGGASREYEAVCLHAAKLDMLERITFAGYVPAEDLGGFYHRARAVIFPTFFGPTNIPPLEAIACGCPVAVSRIYGMPEQLGDAALYFDPKSVEEMAEIMKQLWEDETLCARLNTPHRTRTQEQFNQEFHNIVASLRVHA